MPALEHPLGWRAPYWTALVLALAALPVLAPSAADTERPHRESLSGRVLSDGRLYRLGAMHAATFGLSVVAGNWIVTLLTRTSGFSHEKAGAVGTFVLLGGLVTRPLGGVLIRLHSDVARAIVLALHGRAGLVPGRRDLAEPPDGASDRRPSVAGWRATLRRPACGRSQTSSPRIRNSKRGPKPTRSRIGRDIGPANTSRTGVPRATASSQRARTSAR